MTLRIGTTGGKAFTLPADLVTQTAAVLAKKGSGKSYTAAVMAEELLESGQQVVIIDPTGAHWGLRSSADGKAAGFPIVVVGGDHADLPLEEGAGEVLARAVVERRFSAIVDLSLLRKGAATRFLGAFFEALYRLNRAPLHLICDEADVYAPQRPFAEEARTLGAIEDIVRRGRIRGIGCTLITQRPAVVNKNVLTQCELLIALRLAHPKDIGAVMEWVEVHASKKDAAAMLASLPALPIGTAWFWSPGWGDIFERVQVRARRTFDSGATPKHGETVKAPKVLAEIDVEKLGAEIKATAEKAKADDPRELRRRIAELERQVAAKPAPAQAVETRVEIPVLTKEEIALIQRVLSEMPRIEAAVREVLPKAAELAERARDLTLALGRAQRLPAVPPAPVQRHITMPGPSWRRIEPTPWTTPPAADGSVSGPELRILNALIDLEGIGVQDPEREQVAFLAGYSNLNSKGFANGIGALNSAGRVSYPAQGRIRIEDSGRKVAKPLPDLLGAEALHERICTLLGGASSKILRPLIAVYPQSLERADLARQAGYENVNSKGFANAMGRLRSLGFIDYPQTGQVGARQILFPGGAS